LPAFTPLWDGCEIISLVGYDWFDEISIIGNFPDGSCVFIQPLYDPEEMVSDGQVSQTLTGLTNIALYGLTAVRSTNAYASWATFKITTPCSTTVISNYVPADAVVIPSSATGNVQIILLSAA
jgi:hypothetical protein